MMASQRPAKVSDAGITSISFAMASSMSGANLLLWMQSKPRGL